MDKINRQHLSFEWLPWPSLTTSKLQECANLFSDHYGFWGPEGVNPGKRIRLSVEKLSADWSGDHVWMALCHYKGNLIGYAIAVRDKLKGRGHVSWVTQLVVHSAYRHQKIATELLQSIWAFSDDFAWGLVTANPFTVRALEKATRRRCSLETITRYQSLLRNIGNANISFVKDAKVTIDTEKAVVDTGFYVDHSNIETMLADAAKKDPWTLGKLGPCEEWFAFTFREQESFELASEEFNQLMADSERSVRLAYERMSLDSNHLWASYTESESLFIKNAIGHSKASSLLDFGCGTGRHSIAMARLGFTVLGIDFIDAFIKKAQEDASKKQVEQVEFVRADCRHVQLGRQFDAGISIYDVIGSFRDEESNLSILRNLSDHIKIGGKVLISVMNLALTRNKAKYFGTLPQDLNKFTDLKPSRTMQHTGNIFDPDYYFLDECSKVVYRKEQFDEDLKLPAQIIVADRRYTKADLVQLCEAVGFKKIWCKCVQAGNWNVDLADTDPHAKEVLFLGKKFNHNHKLARQR